MWEAGYFYSYNHTNKCPSNKLRRIINYHQIPYKVLQNIGTMAYKLEIPTSSRVHPIFHVSCLKKVIGENLPVQTIFPKLDEEGKPYWNLKQSWKQELDNYEIDQFQSISSNGRTYPLKILHGRMRSLYRSTQSYSSIEDNTFLRERGMLGPYITILAPYCY